MSIRSTPVYRSPTHALYPTDRTFHPHPARPSPLPLPVLPKTNQSPSFRPKLLTIHREQRSGEICFSPPTFPQPTATQPTARRRLCPCLFSINPNKRPVIST